VNIPLDPVWHDALLAAGARFANGHPMDYGDAPGEVRACTEATVLCDLAHLAVVRASGADAVTFLHGQFTADLAGLEPGRSTLAAYCTPKGRVLALARAWRDPVEGMWLVLPRAIAEQTVARLRMFVLRARVVLSGPDAGLAAFGIAGADAARQVAERTGAWPQPDCGVQVHGSVQVARVPGLAPRAMITGPAAEVATLWGQWRTALPPVSGHCWARHDLAAGLPWVQPETVETFLPQSLNLDALGGVSFRKGCYPGQEIVARTRYLGRVKQRMYPAHGSGATPPGRGERLYCAALGDQPAGYVVEALEAPGGGWDALVTAPRAAPDTRPLCLGGPGGPALATGEPPYPLPADEGGGA